MVEYIGYGGGRGRPIDWLLPPSAGYAHLVMDIARPGQRLAVRRHPRSRHRRRDRPVPGLHDPRHPGPGDVLLPAAHDRRGAGRRGRPRQSAGRSRARRRERRQPGRRAVARGRRPRAGPDAGPARRAVHVPLAARHRDHRQRPVPRDRPVRARSTATRPIESSRRSRTSTASTSPPEPGRRRSSPWA